MLEYGQMTCRIDLVAPVSATDRIPTAHFHAPYAPEMHELGTGGSVDGLHHQGVTGSLSNCRVPFLRPMIVSSTRGSGF